MGGVYVTDEADVDKGQWHVVMLVCSFNTFFGNTLLKACIYDALGTDLNVLKCTYSAV